MVSHEALVQPRRGKRADALGDPSQHSHRAGPTRDLVVLLERAAAQRAATAADLMAVFDEKLAQLREQQRRRPTFIAMLDKAALR
jgi:hypothetical protein